MFDKDVHDGVDDQEAAAIVLFIFINGFAGQLRTTITNIRSMLRLIYAIVI